MAGMHDAIHAMEACRILGHPSARWVRRVVSNGGVHLCYWCDECRRSVTKERCGTSGQSVRADWLLEHHGIRAEDVPEIRSEVAYTLCTACHATGPCEMHHIAPKAIFGARAEHFPIIPLCKSCHDELTAGFERWRRAA